MDRKPAITIDSSVAHPARVYDYLLGGKDNYAPDRELADAMAVPVPNIRAQLRANRDFMQRAARYLVTERGITQFLDIGSGIPTAPNLHQVAQEFAPSARVVYVDNDPIVLAHARALMTCPAPGATAFVLGDALDPAAILADPAVFGTVDRTRPIALMLISLLMYFTEEEAHMVIDTFLDALPAGSHLVISHPTSDFDPEATAAAVAAAQQRGIVYNARPRAEFERFFQGVELVEPGVVPLLNWRPGIAHPNPRSVHYLAGMGVR